MCAQLFTVNSPVDPAVADPANCAGSAQPASCSFRDALAAADQTTDIDSIVFNVKQTIYLRKQLTAEQPVNIDGAANGKSKTVVRVHQGYTTVMLADRFAPYNEVPVLQPIYFSINGSSRPMLKLHGDGSSISNMIFDGSITPNQEDIGVQRIDYNSDNQTDFLLYTLENPDGDDRWPIAGGINASFDPVLLGEVEISSNKFQNHNDSAIALEFVRNSTIDNNTVEGGLAGLPFGSGSGISIYTGGSLAITNNRVADFREGIAITIFSGVIVSGNDTRRNEKGMVLEYADTSYGDNRVEGNKISENATIGLDIRAVAGMKVDNNKVKSNGTLGVDIKTSGFVEFTNNQVKENGTDATFNGGIRVAEESGGCTILGNEVKANSGFGIVVDSADYNNVSENQIADNGGAGIALINASDGNSIASNTSKDNQIGLLLVTLTGIYPAANQLAGNILLGNSVFDAADYDSSCGNFWSGNSFESVNPESGVCIH